MFQITTLLLLLIWVGPFPVLAEERLSVAVAANYMTVFQEIAADFEEKNGVRVEATFGSTGSLYNQIKNGAPYDVFLSADEERPDLLQKEGWTEGSIIYARGKVILWSADQDFCNAATWHDALKDSRIKKISIVNPKTSPYGAASLEALQKAGLEQSMRGKMVIAQTAAQSFQYASTGAVTAGFCALSASAGPRGRKGCFYVVEEAPDIVQAACVAKNAKNKVNAELFAAYLLCGDAAKIRKKYGYR